MSREKDRRKNIFVLCLDDFHSRDLEHIPDRAEFNFRGLLTKKELVGSSGPELEDAIARAEEVLYRFDEPVDAITPSVRMTTSLR
jgi:hypothetical protein